MNLRRFTHGWRHTSLFLAGIAAIAATIVSLLACALIPSHAHAAGSTAFIRINQMGYATSASKRAYLMASAAATGATFAVKNGSGTTVATGTVGESLGSLSTAYPDVYVLDFDAVTAAGSYTVVVSGPIAATSASFRVNTASALYASALVNALSFYQNERDGANYIPSPLRTAPGHLNDSTAMTYLTPAMNNNGRFSGDLTTPGVQIDASGGWWDSGDYLKFVETTSYTVAILGMGVRDFPTQLGAAVEGPNSTTSKGLVSGMLTSPANGIDTYAQINGSSATYQDNVQSWSTDEPAIDLTAASPLAFAWQLQP